jgi:hypothetical protein
MRLRLPAPETAAVRVVLLTPECLSELFRKAAGRASASDLEAIGDQHARRL